MTTFIYGRPCNAQPGDAAVLSELAAFLRRHRLEIDSCDCCNGARLRLGEREIADYVTVWHDPHHEDLSEEDYNGAREIARAVDEQPTKDERGIIWGPEIGPNGIPVGWADSRPPPPGTVLKDEQGNVWRVGPVGDSEGPAPGWDANGSPVGGDA